MQQNTTATVGHIIAEVMKREGVDVLLTYPLNSLTGLFQPFLNGHFARTKAAFRVEKTPTWTPANPQGNPAADNLLDNPGNPPAGWGEPDPSGKNWNWCKTGS